MLDIGFYLDTAKGTFLQLVHYRADVLAVAEYRLVVSGVAQYCAGDKIEKNEMSWACGAYG